MLKIFNNLRLFFEDAYKEINVREYARKTGISPPTASKLLKQYSREGILQSRAERNCMLYRANREDPLYVDLTGAYFRKKLSSLAAYLLPIINYETIILFGSLSKGEATLNSDIDIFLNCSPKQINLKPFEKSLKRKIQLHFKSEIKNNKLKRNIQRGIALYGDLI